MDTKKKLRERINHLHAELELQGTVARNLSHENEMIGAAALQLDTRLKDRDRETRDRALDQAINSVTRLGAVDVVELARTYEAYLSGAPNSSVSNEELDFRNALEEANYAPQAVEDISRIAREAGVL